ncbi:MAG: ABC1 kinase family protein [Thermoguttaceae bacterium]
MKLSTIPQIYRHFNRWREILAVLSKFGLADWISRLGPEFAKDLLKNRGGEAIARQGWQIRMRMALAELGPTFIKLGQVLSTRPDLVGVSLANELQHLQTQVPADPPEKVLALIQRELGQPAETLFAQFDPLPVASASIGQVHRAELKTGEPVVVKVQHAEIERKLEVDLDILVGLAQWAEKVPEFVNYHPRAIATEFQRTVRRELDFRRELRNMQEFARQFFGDPTVHVPRVYPQLSRSRVLVMERVDGIRLQETDRLRAAGIDLNEVARRGAALYMKMIFTHGCYHADPHPGNLVLMEGGVIGLLDFGMVGRIDERLREDIEEIVLAAGDQDAEHVTSIITRIGAIPAELDRSALSVDVSDFVSHYGSQSLGDFDLSGALNDMTEMIRRYRISLPARMALLLKVLVTLEGTGRQLSPQFSLIEVILPYRKRMLVQRFSVRRQFRRMRRFYWEFKHLIDVLPRGMVEILEQVQSGKFDVHLDHRGLEPSVNRLVQGMLASALFLGSAVLLGLKVAPQFHEISIPGLAGCLLGLGSGWRVWRAIGRSMDRRR